MQLVCNASPLIFLAKIDLINVLPLITDSLQIPIGVYNEINGYNDMASEWVEKHKKKYVIETDTVPKIIESWDLGKGETEVIVYTNSRGKFCRRKKTGGFRVRKFLSSVQT